MIGLGYPHSLQTNNLALKARQPLIRKTHHHCNKKIRCQNKKSKFLNAEHGYILAVQSALTGSTGLLFAQVMTVETQMKVFVVGNIAQSACRAKEREQIHSFDKKV